MFLNFKRISALVFSCYNILCSSEKLLYHDQFELGASQHNQVDLVFSNGEKREKKEKQQAGQVFWELKACYQSSVSLFTCVSKASTQLINMLVIFLLTKYVSTGLVPQNQILYNIGIECGGVGALKGQTRTRTQTWDAFNFLFFDICRALNFDELSHVNVAAKEQAEAEAK